MVARQTLDSSTLFRVDPARWERVHIGGVPNFGNVVPLVGSIPVDDRVVETMTTRRAKYDGVPPKRRHRLQFRLASLFWMILSRCRILPGSVV